MDPIITAILLGIVEGLTEFIPVSSTGHLILATQLFGYDPATWEVFNIVIQLGAILAVVVLYWRTFWAVGMGLLRGERMSWLFLRNLLLGFMPAAVLGVLFKHQIDALLESPLPVGWALLLGGIAILVIERYAKPDGPMGIGQMPMKTALGIGVVQCLAMIPGISRSGATIMGALAMGVERRTAAEFSFFLAIPTMLGATTLQVFDHREELMSGTGTVGWGEIGIGFVVAFFVALAVIRLFVTYVSRHGFAPFAWYRIVLGAAAIAWLAMG
ncbi:MAG: undecaprenyl-diphosphate phosphatase [Sphingomonadales bacterium]|nr:undecaprenyl-diphosphate phosphatase [Sphingomonadales bacterium]MBD3775291.1 undecaprenyl-diphosphate phosphatase [Paracoccaceae bacterium]